MNRRTFLAATLVGSGGLARAAVKEKEKVKIVSSLPRTGAAKDQTDAIVNGIQMAIAAVEKVVPFEVEYLDWDDATARAGDWDATRERELAEKAVEDKDVVALIGPYNSGAARVSSPILNKAGLVQVTPSASWPGLTKKTPTADDDEPEKYRPGKRITFCRVCPHDGSQGPLSADFAAQELKAKTVYVLDDKELYGHGLATAFKKRCEELKIKVLAHESINTRSNDFAPLMKKVKEANPDLVYFGGTTQSKGGAIAKALKAEGLARPLLLPDGCYEPAFVNAVGADVLDEMKCFVTVAGINPANLVG
ncbi:MAG: branched-chain amino acid ABC transporter substrate-binding protein, partial [Gemmataceae bacterium]|nr:branched-chain amino acid ABC transporter substrate-binding protein [Gemmataceae bacterium]